MGASTFGSRLRAARSARGLTQFELAAASDIALRSIASYEADDVQPNADGLARLCGVLDVSADSLLGLPAHSSTLAPTASSVESPS